MKKEKVLALLLSTAMLVSCAKAPEETEKETEEETTTTVEETTEETTAEEATEETTAEPTATPTPRPTATPTPSPTPAPEPEHHFITANGEPFEEYLVTDYTFSEDGSSGTFTVERYISFTADEVADLAEGDILVDDMVIQDVESNEEHTWITVRVGEYGTEMHLQLQENGLYYIFDDIGWVYTEPAGEMTLPVSSDVLIFDYVDPYGPEGIRINDEWVMYFDSVPAFADRIDDEDVISIPDLHIRVVNGEVTIMSVNPWQHQPWFMC